VVAATVLALWQQYLIRDRDPALCFQAFLNNNWFGLVLFIGLVLDYQFKGIT
jgi:4-hydroxybenzoate polyprenyltransferase